MPLTLTPPRSASPRPVQTYCFMRGRKQFLEKLQTRHGDAFGIHFQKRPWTVLANPEMIKQVFTAPATVLHAGDANEILRPALGKHSILLLDEGEHMRQRKLLLPPFHGERLAAQRAAMERVAAQQVERFPRGTPFEMRTQGQAIALEIILEVVLGTAATGEEHDRLAGPVEAVLEWIASPARLALTGTLGARHRLVKRMYGPILKPLDDALYRLISERRATPGIEQRDDILSMLLTVEDEDGNGMSDAELRDELVTLIIAGHETTSTALAWAFERLTRDREALARLEAESLTDQTEWTEAISLETLRLRPVLDFVVRTVKQPIEIGGYMFEPGDVVAPCIYLVHRRADIYEDPNSFKPERWLGVKPGTYTWLPFGGGVRRCIGSAFAMTEMEVVLRAVARGVHLEAVGPPEQPVPRFITSSPSRGGQVLVPASV
ncbi:MAG: cytochrome P450 [Actinomycetes bacterium]